MGRGLQACLSPALKTREHWWKMGLHCNHLWAFAPLWWDEGSKPCRARAVWWPPRLQANTLGKVVGPF